MSQKPIYGPLGPGARYTKLVTVRPDETGAKRVKSWLCRCDCGGEKVVLAHRLRNGEVGSCGCLANRGPIQHGRAATPEYRSWRGAKDRCFNPNNKAYAYYGGRGISVAEEWKESFEAFFEHMGLRPSPQHSLDRIDGDGDYRPGNCRWATRKQQNNNRRDANRYVMVGETRMTVSEAAELTGINFDTICKRLNQGLPDHLAVSPKNFRRPGVLVAKGFVPDGPL